jgi:ketosteroid isomerase-like protein
MSEENVEIVRRVVEAVNARQIPETLLARDFRAENVNTAVSNKVYVGWAGAREWQDDFFGVMDDEARFEVKEIVGAGKDCVVVVLQLAGHGLKSGAPLELRWPSVFWLRDQLITRAVGYSTKRGALEAAGLLE